MNFRKVQRGKRVHYVSIHTRHFWRVNSETDRAVSSLRLVFQSTPAISGG